MSADPQREDERPDDEDEDLDAPDWKTREDWPRPWMAEFLKHLALIPNLTAGARAVGLSREAIRKQRIRHKDFDAACLLALDESVDNVESYAHQMSTTGIETVERHVEKKEELVDGKLVVVEQRTREVTRRFISPHMAALFLAAHRPEKWRRPTRLEHTGADGQPIQTTAVPEEKIEHAVGELTARVSSLADARRARERAAGNSGG